MTVSQEPFSQLIRMLYSQTTLLHGSAAWAVRGRMLRRQPLGAALGDLPCCSRSTLAVATTSPSNGTG